MGTFEDNMQARQDWNKERYEVKKISRKYGIDSKEVAILMDMAKKKSLTEGEISLVQQIVIDTAKINSVSSSSQSGENVLPKIIPIITSLEDALKTKVSYSPTIADIELRLKKRLWQYIHKLSDDVSVTISAIKEELREPGNIPLNTLKVAKIAIMSA